MSEELQQKLRTQLWTVANTLRAICQPVISCISLWALSFISTYLKR